MNTELSDGVIRLRPLRPDDAPLHWAAVRESIDELLPWMPWCRPDYSLADSAKFVVQCSLDWARDQHYAFAILPVDAPRFLGTIGINFINREHHVANIGYWVRSGATRRGIAPAAVRLIAAFGFKIGFDRLEILAATGNRASQRVAEKVGATREGILRRRLRIRTRTHDGVVYSLLPQDLPAPAVQPA